MSPNNALPGDLQVDYDILQDVGLKFRFQADEIYELLGILQRRTDDLQVDGWLGEAASRFYAEMAYDVLPALRRLAVALDEAQLVTRQLGETYLIAEEDAAGQFQVLAA